MELAIETHGLTRDFGQFRAVNGVDLAVPAGSFYGFLGPNGAGKSTTIKCLTGLLKPTAGSMRILGLDPLAEPVAVKRRIGVVPEDLALFDRLTARETLTFVADVHGIDAGTATHRSADLLRLMALEDAADTLREARRPKRRGRGLLLIVIGIGAAFVLSEGLRKKALDTLFGAEEEFEYTSPTTPATNAGSSSAAPAGATS